MFQLMDIINTWCLNASTVPVITVIWCIFCHFPSIKLWMYSLTVLRGSLWGTLSREWIMQRTSTKIRPFCRGWKLMWTHYANLMLKTLTQLFVIKQVSATRLLSHLYCIIKICVSTGEGVTHSKCMKQRFVALVVLCLHNVVVFSDLCLFLIQNQ